MHTHKRGMSVRLAGSCRTDIVDSIHRVPDVRAGCERHRFFCDGPG